MKKPMKKENIYIQTLSFANNYPDGFTKENLMNNLDADKGSLEIISKYFEFADYNITTVVGNAATGFDRETIFIRISDREDTLYYILTSSAYFDYLSYIELSEARISSRQARFWSILALVISIGTGLGSIGAQIFGNISLKKEQFEKIENLSENSKTTNAKIDVLIDQVNKISTNIIKK